MFKSGTPKHKISWICKQILHNMGTGMLYMVKQNNENKNLPKLFITAFQLTKNQWYMSTLSASPLHRTRKINLLCSVYPSLQRLCKCPPLEKLQMQSCVSLTGWTDLSKTAVFGKNGRHGVFRGVCVEWKSNRLGRWLAQFVNVINKWNTVL